MNRVECRGGCGRLVIDGKDGGICRKCRREVVRLESKAKRRVKREGARRAVIVADMEAGVAKRLKELDRTMPASDREMSSVVIGR